MGSVRPVYPLHVRSRRMLPVGNSGTAAPNTPSSDQPAMPSLEEVHTRSVPVLKFIPKQLRGLWGQCLSKSLATATFHNDVPHWLVLEMLTKCVLCAPP